MVNCEWEALQWDCWAEFKPMEFQSDHCPVLLHLIQSSTRGPKPFKFFNMWLKHDSFDNTLKHVWDMRINGTRQFRLCRKLKLLKHPVKHLNNKDFAHISSRAEEARKSYTDLMDKLYKDPDNLELLQLVAITRKKASFYSDAERSFFQQKVKCNFINEGDKCTKFFHAMVKKQSVLNAIPVLITSQVDWNVFKEGPLIQHQDATELVRNVDRTEVKEALFSIGYDKAPGPDGYTAAFFKKKWDIVGDTVFDAVSEFFLSGRLLKQINHALVVLIPKIRENPSAKDYRPIACSNVVYKINIKILSNRMAGLLPSLINPAQAGFIKGRSIVDNILLVQHLGIGFPPTFVNWVMECVTTASFSLSINGGLHGFIKCKRGIRQGDPMAPTLCLFCMEYLRRLIRRMLYGSRFTFHNRCSKLGITHVTFADDVMMFCRGNVDSVNVLAKAINIFSQVSGLHVNPLKSNIFLAGEIKDRTEDILALLPFPQGKLPVRYLGLPLTSQRASERDFAPLVNKVDEHIRKWNAKTLSAAGRLELIRSVTQGIEGFWFQAFPIHKSVLDRITSLCRTFLWVSKFCKVAWEDICKPKDEGGLGLNQPRIWNQALLSKNLWNIASNKETLWVQWVHSVYLDGNDFWTWSPGKKDSHFFKKLIEIRDMLLLKCGDRWELENQLCDQGDISVTKVYDLLRTRAVMRPLMKAIWKPYIPPRYSFCAWLIFRNRIPTKTSLHFIAMENRLCELCHKEEETGQHLFFSCETSTLIWNAVRSWLEIAPALSSLDRAFTWLRRLRNNHCSKRKMKRLAILSTAYHIWRLRNGYIPMVVKAPPPLDFIDWSPWMLLVIFVLTLPILVEDLLGVYPGGMLDRGLTLGSLG
ncbi:unnamed protein product [Cuscuta campestris]|uniref:Reverse transcriptase domain-containing protein n=1 Tax=Cuscuta campestris TaxID=132261 RepID=A0A484KLY7_9ASTE|nr:unnamed protein product [Cuscuta campestris]